MRITRRRFAAIFAAAAVVCVAAISTVPVHAGPEEPGAQPPVLQPGWPSKGSIHVTGCTVNREHPVCEVTRDGPFGPITIKSEFIPAHNAGGNKGFTFAWDTCYADWRGGYPSYWYEMWTPWSYDFSTVTAMNPTYFDDHSIPLFGWGDHQAYNDWQSGWQYAWGNARADLTYGWPFAADIGSLHLNALVDAWGNCTPDSDFDWF